MEIYQQYGIEHSKAAVARGIRRAPAVFESIARGFWPRGIDGDPTLVPADFLLGAGPTVRVAYYGADIGDHLPLSRIKAFLTNKEFDSVQSHE